MRTNILMHIDSDSKVLIRLYDMDDDIYSQWYCAYCKTWNSELRNDCRQEGCTGKMIEAKVWR